MSLPVDTVRMSVEEILADLHADHREVSAIGPEATLEYLERTVRDTIDLPQAVLMVVYELISEVQAELQDWDGCSASMAKALEARRLARAESPTGYLDPGKPAAPQTAAPIEPVPLKLRELPDLPSGASQEAPLRVEPALARSPEPVRAKESSTKFCCTCHRDVTHRARRKDPVTKTYLCNACYDLQRGAQAKIEPSLRRPILWIALLSLLVLSVAVLVRI